MFVVIVPSPQCCHDEGEDEPIQCLRVRVSPGEQLDDYSRQLLVLFEGSIIEQSMTSSMTIGSCNVVQKLCCCVLGQRKECRLFWQRVFHFDHRFLLMKWSNAISTVWLLRSL